MYLKLSLLILLTNVAYGKSMNVISPFWQYEVVSDLDGITLKGRGNDLSLRKKSCNEHIVKKFNYKFVSLFEKGAFSKEPIKGGLNVIFGKEVFYLAPTAKLTTIFTHLPKEIQRIKFESRFACSTSKSKKVKE